MGRRGRGEPGPAAVSDLGESGAGASASTALHCYSQEIYIGNTLYDISTRALMETRRRIHKPVECSYIISVYFFYHHGKYFTVESYAASAGLRNQLAIPFHKRSQRQ